MFYVDRVVLYKRKVPRMCPTIKGWTTRLLRDRENDEVKSGGFGFGDVDGPVKKERKCSDEEFEYGNTRQQAAMECEESLGEDLMVKFAKKTNVLVQATSDIMLMFE
ncbi:unnamed protein product, partial [Cuscuta europaea]